MDDNSHQNRGWKKWRLSETPSRKSLWHFPGFFEQTKHNEKENNRRLSHDTSRLSLMNIEILDRENGDMEVITEFGRNPSMDIFHGRLSQPAVIGKKRSLSDEFLSPDDAPQSLYSPSRVRMETIIDAGNLSVLDEEEKPVPKKTWPPLVPPPPSFPEDPIEKHRPDQFINWFQQIYSMQNILACSNLILIFMVVLMMSCLCYFLGRGATISTIHILGENLIEEVNFNLMNTMNDASRFAQQQMLTYIKGQYPFDDPNHVAHMVYYGLLSQPGEIDGVQVTRISSSDDLTQSTLVSVSWGGHLLEPSDDVVVGYYANFTSPNFTNYYRNQNCGALDVSCELARRNSPLYDTYPFYLGQEPVYRMVMEQRTQTWVPVHRLMDFEYGLTAVVPVFVADKLEFLAAVDISIVSLGYLLTTIVESFLKAHQGVLFVVDQNNATYVDPGCPVEGLLVASSFMSPDQYTFWDRNEMPCRLPAIDSEDEDVRSISRFIVARMGPWSTLEFTSDESHDNVVFYDGYVLLLRQFNIQASDIRWIVVFAIDETLFLQGFNNIYVVILPVLAPCLIMISILTSLLVVRRVTKRLNHIAKHLLAISHLDFDKGGGFRVPDTFSYRELGKIEEAASFMVSGLKSFSRYVPRDVVNLLILTRQEAILGVEEAEMTVSCLCSWPLCQTCCSSDSCVLILYRYHR